MAFRSHLARDFSLKHPAHGMVFLAAAVVGLLAGIDWLVASEGLEVLLAPIYVGVVWALTREIDPDHQWTAIVGGLVAGICAVYVGPPVALLAVVGLMAAARVMTETTGRRPLLTDIVGLGVFGVIASYTPEGWVAGIVIAVALLVDDRQAQRRLTAQRWVAAGVAIAGTAVAWLSGVSIPQDVQVVLSVTAAALGLVLIVRAPAEPGSVVDARHGAPLQVGRLQTSRVVTAVAVYGIAVMLGADGATESVPLLIVMALIIVSNEVERARRRR